MKRLLLLCLLVWFWASAGCSPVEKITRPGTEPMLYGKICRPPSPGPHPAVVLLHGRWGFHEDHVALAETLAAQGYTTLALDYYNGRPALYVRMLGNQWDAWERTIGNAVSFLRNTPGVLADRIGLVGFSQGGFLALSTARSLPGVKAVVSYYGGALKEPTDDDIRGLPPVLLIHGEADTVVPPECSRRLYKALVRLGKTADLVIYPGAAHAFNFNGPNEDVPATEDAHKRMLTFLGEYLKP